MSKTTESNMNEMINSAGDGSGLQLPPAFVMVNPRQHRKYKKNNETVAVSYTHLTLPTICSV